MIEASGCLPYRTIDQDADLIMVCALDLTNDQPTLRQKVCRREGGRQGVVVTAAEDKGVRVRAGGSGNGLQWFGDLEGILAQVDEDTRCPSHMS